MPNIIRADRLEGGRVAYDVETFVEYPIPIDVTILPIIRRTLYKDEANTWIYREERLVQKLDTLARIELAVRGIPSSDFDEGRFRIVSAEQAEEMLRSSGVPVGDTPTIPPTDRTPLDRTLAIVKGPRMPCIYKYLWDRPGWAASLDEIVRALGKKRSSTPRERNSLKVAIARDAHDAHIRAHRCT